LRCVVVHSHLVGTRTCACNGATVRDQPCALPCMPTLPVPRGQHQAAHCPGPGKDPCGSTAKARRHSAAHILAHGSTEAGAAHELAARRSQIPAAPLQGRRPAPPPRQPMASPAWPPGAEMCAPAVALCFQCRANDPRRRSVIESSASAPSSSEAAPSSAPAPAAPAAPRDAGHRGGSGAVPYVVARIAWVK
jgi:hypothetical protein